MSDDQKQAIAAMLKNWRGEATQAQAAAALGMSLRTYQHVEQGRGFAYPRVLELAIGAVKAG